MLGRIFLLVVVHSTELSIRLNCLLCVNIVRELHLKHYVSFCCAHLHGATTPPEMPQSGADREIERRAILAKKEKYH